MTALKRTKPKIADIVDTIGLGPTHLRFICTGGGVWFADGCELSLMSTIAVAVSLTFEVGPLARGMLVTIVYMGVLCGNLMSGPCDSYGRRFCLLASYLLVWVFSVMSSFAPSYAILAIIRFFVGFSFGFGQPVVNALMSEVAPTKWRIVVNGGAQSLFCIGEIYCFFIVYLQDPWMRNLDWRSLLRQGAIPALVFLGLSLLLLHESPYYFSFVGRKRDAQEVLQSMQRENCAPELDDVDFQIEDLDTKKEDPNDGRAYSLQQLRNKYEDVYDEQKLMEYWQFACQEQNAGSDVDITSGYGAIFTQELYVTTIVMTYTCFVMNFSYYGLLYAFPILLPGVSHIGHTLTPAVELMIGACWELPGFVLAAIFCSMSLCRKPVLKMYMLAFATAACSFAVGFGTGCTVLWHIGFYASKALINVAFVVIYTYLGEVYPTNVRVTGSGFSIAVGRVGAMLAPLAFELLTYWTGAVFPFFAVICILTLINVPLVDLLPDGAGANLSAACESKASYGSMQTLPH